MKKRRLFGILTTIVVLLLIPFIAMQFSSEVNWSVADFVIAAILLTGTGLLCEFVIRRIQNKKYRIGICFLILLALFLVWAELAVGLFGTPLAGS